MAVTIPTRGSGPQRPRVMVRRVVPPDPDLGGLLMGRHRTLAVVSSATGWCKVCAGLGEMRLVALFGAQTHHYDADTVIPCPHCKPGGAPVLVLSHWREERVS